MIRQRTQMGLNELASERKWPNDSPPLGYELNSERKLSVVEEEKQLVAEIFQLYIEEKSMPEVAMILNDQGIETQSGGEWTARAVGDILRNEIYKGRYEVADVSAQVSEYQLINPDTFEQVKSLRHRFQNDESSKPRMSNPRKEQAIQRMREMYDEFHSLNSVGGN
jgi:site-specific DNA recombinase